MRFDNELREPKNAPLAIEKREAIQEIQRGIHKLEFRGDRSLSELNPILSEKVTRYENIISDEKERSRGGQVYRARNTQNLGGIIDNLSCFQKGEERNINENQSLCTSCEKMFAEEEEREYNSCKCCGTSIELGENLCDKCKGDLSEEFINAGYEAP